MPQLDFSTFPSQAFWLVVSFALMWLVMAKMIVPKITDILNQRQRKIDDYLTAAGEFKQTAEEALEKYERVLREANAEAAENLRKAGEELEKKIAAREAEKAAGWRKRRRKTNVGRKKPAADDGADRKHCGRVGGADCRPAGTGRFVFGRRRGQNGRKEAGA